MIATLGHQDQLVIADAGLPIPDSTTRIDLALTAGVPTFLQTL
ncbi:MAG TPA: RbsD/FucU domain-containing protein, partial [Anaerolineaceae bacterium]|nr:RbsD/FucU domain-containing protein [Anaerolineaceae bacterium]